MGFDYQKFWWLYDLHRRIVRFCLIVLLANLAFLFSKSGWASEPLATRIPYSPGPHSPARYAALWNAPLFQQPVTAPEAPASPPSPARFILTGVASIGRSRFVYLKNLVTRAILELTEGREVRNGPSLQEVAVTADGATLGVRILDEGQSFWLALDGQSPAEEPAPTLVKARDYTDAEVIQFHLKRQQERRARATMAKPD